MKQCYDREEVDKYADSVNECFMAVASRLDASIAALDHQEIDKALHILKKLRGILPEPEQRHIDSALVELQK